MLSRERERDPERERLRERERETLRERDVGVKSINKETVGYRLMLPRRTHLCSRGTHNNAPDAHTINNVNYAPEAHAFMLQRRCCSRLSADAPEAHTMDSWPMVECYE
jgi:hypothetical protein